MKPLDWILFIVAMWNVLRVLVSMFSVEGYIALKFGNGYRVITGIVVFWVLLPLSIIAWRVWG